jgi:hypothetical protein
LEFTEDAAVGDDNDDEGPEDFVGDTNGPEDWGKLLVEIDNEDGECGTEGEEDAARIDMRRNIVIKRQTSTTFERAWSSEGFVLGVAIAVNSDGKISKEWI